MRFFLFDLQEDEVDIAPRRADRPAWWIVGRRIVAARGRCLGIR
jgi:hypothetical protein